MSLWVRSWSAAALAVLAIAAPGIIATVSSSGVARADVCEIAGRPVVVAGGCANLADTISAYVPPPAYYAPLPQDFYFMLPPPAAGG